MHAWWYGSGLVCLAALVGSLLMAVSGIVLARRRDRWQSALATVVRQGTRLVNTGPGAGYYPATCHYSVAAYTDLDGTRHTLELRELPTGSTVPILFDARRPACACADEGIWRGGLLFLLAVAAVAGLMVALIPAP